MIAYYTKLSGTSFHQDLISKLKVGKSQLRAVACPDNEYDKYAVRVDALVEDEWQQIGWIQKGKNESISGWLQAGGDIDIRLTDVTGGEDDKNYGVNVSISYGTEDKPKLHDLPLVDVQLGDAKQIMWDEREHNAFSLDGDLLLSGSRAEHIFDPEPDLKYPLKALSKSTGVKKEDIEELWHNKRDLSADYGTLVHKALELYLSMKSVSEKIDVNRERPVSAKNWMPETLGEIVDAFVLSSNVSKCQTEVRVKWKRATGIIDLLTKEGDAYVINDYKITKEIKEVKYHYFGEFPKYTVQQNFYREVLEHLGYKVAGMFLWHWDGSEWTKHKVPKLNVMEKLDELRAFGCDAMLS